MPNKKSLLLIVVTILCAIGLIMVYSASYIFALDKYSDGLFFFKKQILYMLVGFIGIFVCSRMTPEFWEKWIRLIIIGCIVLLGLVMIPGLGSRAGGAMRWINIFGFRFQPSEFVKGSAVMYFAYVFSRGDEIPYKKFLMIIPVIGLLLVQPDFGSTAVILSVFLGLFFLKGKNFKAIFGSIAIVAVFAAIAIMNSPYRMKRIVTFLDPWADPSKSGFQVIQSFVAFTAGKFWGAGLGNGREKLFYLPAAHNDFIFSVVGEELGFVGVMAIVLVFLFLTYIGFKIAASAKNDFQSFLAAGFTLLIANQTMINMGVVLGVLPTKGLTLPFISYGGTAIIAFLVWVGILMSVDNGGELGSKKNRKVEKKEK